MSIDLNREKLKAFANELAKDIKTEKDLFHGLCLEMVDQGSNIPTIEQQIVSCHRSCCSASSLSVLLLSGEKFLYILQYDHGWKAKFIMVL